MKKVTKIKRSPRIVQKVENEGCETIYWIGNSAWRWVTGGFTRVFDRIGEDPK